MENEPGPTTYTSWEEKDNPTRFVHLFIFEDEESRAVHGQSSVVRAFEAVYSPELAGGAVIFTDNLEVASNS